MLKWITGLALLIFFLSCKQPAQVSNFTTDRPAYHFTPDSNWINDPNGLLYENGTFHMFFQYNPFGNTWGHMSWGHTTSSDLVHWKYLPVALYEDKNEHDADTSMIFSGSAVMDQHNSSGLGDTAHPPMVAIYTAFVHGGLDAKGEYIAKVQHQDIAYSNDKGLTWKKYSGNPVLDIHSLEFRDPKVQWYAPGNKWVMVVSKPDEHETWFYESLDLKNWTYMSKWGKAGDTSRVWECPDLIELPVSGTTEKKWVLLSSAGHPQPGFVGMQYFVGDFDGKQFVSSNATDKPVYLDHGKDFYAAVCFNHLPNERQVMIGWLNNWEYAREIPTGNRWRGAMSVPRELSLEKTAAGYRLKQHPVAELDGAFQEVYQADQLKADSLFELPFTGNAYRMNFEMEPAKSATCGIRLLKGKNEATEIRYDPVHGELLFDRTHSGNVGFHPKFSSIEKVPVALIDGKLQLNILVDQSIVEVFVNDGAQTITDLVFPQQQEGRLELFSSGSAAQFHHIHISIPKK